MNKVNSRLQLIFAIAALLLTVYLHFYGNGQIVLGSDELHPARTLIGDDWSLTDYPWPEQAVREYYRDWPIQFPPLFGLLTRLAVVCFGSTAFALRFFTALFAVLAAVMSYRLFRLCMPQTWALFSAFMMGAAGRTFIIYAKSLKHYTADVLVTVLLLYLGKQLLNKGTRQYWLFFTVTAVIGLYLAFASLFVSATVFVMLLLNLKRGDNRFRFYFVVSALIYAGAGLILYINFIAGAVSNPVFLRDWSVQILDWNRIFQPDYLVQYVGHIVLHIMKMSRYFYYVGVPVWILFNGLIVIWLYKNIRERNWQDILLCLLPLLFVIVASFAGKYPFSAGRLSLFLLPVWTLMIVGGVYHLCSWLEGKSRLLFFVFILAFAWMVARPVYINILKVDHYKYGGGRRVDLMMQTLKKHARDGDTVFLHWGAILPFYFYYTAHQPGYQSHYPTAEDSGSIRVIYGEERTFHPQAYEAMYKRVESVCGRLWLAFAHRWPEKDMLTLLQRIENERKTKQSWEFDGCKLVLFSARNDSLGNREVE